MMRYLKILFVSMMVIGLMTGSAFAASLNAGNTTYASELVPAAGVGLAAVNTAYQSTGPVAATSQIKVSLTNGTFTPASNVDLCDTAGVSYLTAPGVVPGAPNNTSVTLTLNTPLASGTVYNFQTGACVVGNPPLTNVNIGAGQVGGSTVTMTVDNALNPGDLNIFASATVTTLVDQLSYALVTPAADVIDFAAVPTMSAFTTGLTTSTATLVLLSDETIGTKILSGHPGSNTTCAAWPSGEILRYTVTPGGTATTMGSGFSATTAFRGGVASATILKAAIASTDTSAFGNGTLNAAGFTVFSCGKAAPAASKALAANQTQLQLTVNGTTALTSRSYRAAVDTTTAAAILAAPRNLLAATTAWIWTLDASQYYIPLVGSNPTTGRETYIKLQSKSLLAGSNGVSIAILANDGTTAATFTGAITAGTPLTITGAELVAAATAAGKTVDGMAGFAVIVTVNAPEADVFAYANMIDSAGAKRVPVKTVGGTIVE